MDISIDKSYLELNLPKRISDRLPMIIDENAKIDNGFKSSMWDIVFDELNSCINVSEISGEITHSQANYLREKYLRMELND